MKTCECKRCSSMIDAALKVCPYCEIQRFRYGWYGLALAGTICVLLAGLLHRI